MKLSPSVRGSIRRFARWVANRTVGPPWLDGIDITAIFEEPSAREAAFAVYCNVLEVDEVGQVTNFKQAERRAAEHIRAYCDPAFQPEVPFADWEVELHPVSAERWSGEGCCGPDRNRLKKGVCNRSTFCRSGTSCTGPYPSRQAP